MTGEFSEKNIGLTGDQVEKSPLGIALSKFMLETESLYEQGFTEFRRRFRDYRFCDEPYCFEITFGAQYFEPPVIWWPGNGSASYDKECIVIPRISTEISVENETLFCLRISLVGLTIPELIVNEYSRTSSQVLLNSENRFILYKINEPKQKTESDTLFISYPVMNDDVKACNALLKRALSHHANLKRIVEQEQARQLKLAKIHEEEKVKEKHPDLYKTLNELKDFLK